MEESKVSEFVLLCKCNSIITNSEEFVGLCEEMAAFQGTTSNDPYFTEKGCSYVQVLCLICNSIVGRSYLATCTEEDFRLNLFWLYMSKISAVYVLGECNYYHDTSYFLMDRANTLKTTIKHLSEAISSAQATLVSLETRINALPTPKSKKRFEPTPISSDENIEMNEREEVKREKTSEDPPTQGSDEEIDLTKFGSSESAVWGDGWKLSLQWVKKHPPSRVPKKRDCVVCGARCVMICQICNVYLHTRNACYAKYHMNPDKYDKKPAKRGHVCKACGKPRKGHPGKPGLKHCIFANK